MFLFKTNDKLKCRIDSTIDLYEASLDHNSSRNGRWVLCSLGGQLDQKSECNLAELERMVRIDL